LHSRPSYLIKSGDGRSDTREEGFVCGEAYPGAHCAVAWL
jgi:hypothetical protein